MANRFFSPNQQFYNDTGSPYANGKLYFYASGTSTPQDTYSNSGLTIANLNPVILDSAGRAGSVFLANSAYKVTLTDENDVPIWTEDPVWSSDYSTVAMFTVHSGTPNGTVAGTAGTQGGRPSDVVWDNVNDILYVCTTSGNTSTTVWTAVNPTSSAGSVATPTGRLTPTSGTPVITTDATAQTAIYYTPYTGSTVPIYSSSFTQQTFAELTLTLVSAHALNTLYDVFAFNNSGVVTLVTGPAWTASTAGSSSRGAGAGTTQISRISGIWVNTVSMTGRNGSTTYSIPANTATYLGTILIDGTAGQVSCYVSVGQNRKFGVWNAYNRKTINLQISDPTGSPWLYTSATIRQSNGAAGNKATVLCGLQEEVINGQFIQLVSVGGTSSFAYHGFGVDSTTTFSGVVAPAAANAAAQTTFISNSAYYSSTVLGISNWNTCEAGTTSSNFYGTSGIMNASVQWQG